MNKTILSSRTGNMITNIMSVFVVGAAHACAFPCPVLRVALREQSPHVSHGLFAPKQIHYRVFT